MQENKNTNTTDSYSCPQCGATMKFKPGTTELYCEYCDYRETIKTHDTPIYELDFEKLAGNMEELNTSLTKVLGCRKCGAEITVSDTLKSTMCTYCGTPLIEADIHEERLFNPSYILPFNIDDSKLESLLDKWIKGLWFAPNKLKFSKMLREQTVGYYIPYWTYDANSYTTYSGEQGIYYTVVVGSGNNRKTVTRVRWYPASGSVSLAFDDIMVSASKLAPQGYLNKLRGWDTHNLLNIDNRFLSGFTTEKYGVNLEDGFARAKEIMDSHIEAAVRNDIGGDTQRVHGKDSSFSDVKFKLVLLPIYISCYRFGGKLYHFYVNGRSGAVAGSRPYSTVKIILAVLAAIIAIGVAIYYYQTVNV